ncbi:MAG TPA: phosphatase PAP2 family protein [Chloroflexia bacterium]|nr:phosphatase PAP2 family protein [Chloroflexia bacterium]
MRNRQRAARHLPIVLAGGLGASLASVFLFGKLADEVLEHESMTFDTRVVEEAREMRSPALDRAMAAATATGEPWALGAAGLVVALRWHAEGRQADIATAALALLGGSVVNQVLKLLFHRDRPALQLRRAHATGYSFPSGHAMTTLATYGTLAYLASRRGGLTGHPAARLLWIPALALCTLVGASRVYLEVHYPTDVLGGWAAATVWITTCGLARTAMEPEES